MGLNPEEKGWMARHSFIVTVVVILLIVAGGIALRSIQQKYFPAEEMEFKEPVFVNQSFEDVNAYFNLESELSDAEKDALFEENYKYNVFKWTCKPIGCQELMGAPTLKLICDERGFTEDLRVAMKEDCKEAALRPEVTVIFQLISKTTGEYYLGRSGTVVASDK
jgi:hypothetical protein